MKFEVFNYGLLGRHDVVAVDMIHYSGLWGLCFSHHHPHNNHPRYAADTSTAGVLRFIDEHAGGAVLSALADYTITTHHFDADSLLPVWALLNQTAALERRDLLERVARCGDFFIYIDDESAQLNFVVEALHQRLRDYGERGERLVDDALTRRCFEWLLPRWGELLADPAGGADLWQEPMREMLAGLEELAQPGRVAELWDHHTSLVEVDHKIDAHALNTACRNDLLLVWRSDTPRRKIEVRPAIGWYDLQSLPHRPRYDLDDLAARLNAAEEAAGHAPAWRHDPGPVWLRAGSSGLSQSRVLDIIEEWLEAAPEDRVPAAYRADVREVFRHWPRHAIYTSHERFASATSLRFAPGAPYDGLHLRMAHAELGVEHRLAGAPLVLDAQHSGPTTLQFAVSDDFYWNRRAPEPLELRVTYEDRGAGSFWVEYDTWADPFRPTAPITLRGDGGASTATFRLDDARLGNSQDWGDLRLVRAPGTQIGIKELVLRKVGKRDA